MVKKLLPHSMRCIYAGIGGTALLLGIFGIFLPLLPATPFLLVAAWAASRSSTSLHHWLWTHPQLGPLLEEWKRRGAIPRNAKGLALISLCLSWLWVFGLGYSWPLLLGLGLCFIALAIFILSRPSF
jgi:uncharacterized membrane protein YbaN (DUF454 family)